MLSISVNTLGKKFNKEWIFRNLACEITAGQKLVISGGNGSGKSTLLQVISGFVTPNEGEIVYTGKEGKAILPEKLKDHISFASPYLHLIEEFTLTELVEHVHIYKPFLNTLSAAEVIELTELTSAKHKLIKQFSSGMKQRLKLGLAILADTPLLLLDEPVSNLDKNAIAWYKAMMLRYAENRTVIVCSNAITEEYAFCDTELNVMDFKTKK
jgi:ABC-type multidrug transport system ATPase subunit